MSKNDAKTKELVPHREISNKLFESFFLPWIALLILVHLVTVYWIPQYLWGISFYHFFPVGIGWISTCLILAILIPGVGEYLYEKLAAFSVKIKQPFDRLGQNLTFLLISLFSLPLFWIFRTRLHLLGDGYFRIQDLPYGRLHLQEWLDGFIHLVIYWFMTKFIHSWTPELTYTIVSILCGGVFVFMSLKLSSFLGKNGFQKVLIFFFLFTLGSVQLFFGYVESYSILQVMLLVYLWFSVRCFAGKSSLYPVLLALVISIGLHVTSLIYIPSFLYLLISRDAKPVPSGYEKASPGGKQKGRSPKEKMKKKTPFSPLVLLALIFAAGVIIWWVLRVASGLEEKGKGMFFVPLKGTVNYPFGMFSIGHILEYVNQLVLLSPVGISLLLFFLFFRIRYRSYRSGGRWEDKTINFLFIASLFALVYLFVVNFTLGSADWDLRCSPAPFFGLLGAMLFLRWGEKTSTGMHQTVHTTVRSPQSTAVKPEALPGKRRIFWRMKPTVQAWGVVFIFFGLYHTVPWVLINSNNDRSADRYMLIQEYDPHPVDETNYNLYKVARILDFAGLSDRVGELYRNATKRNPYDTLSYFNLSAWYHKKDQFDSAMVWADTVLKLDPNYPKANWMMGNIYGKFREYSKALPYLEKAMPYSDMADNPEFLYDLGISNYWTNHPDEAALCAKHIVEIAPDFLGGYHLLGLVDIQKGDMDGAKKAWGKIVELE
ncbi:MAG TPA: tetratricopeptide repeat protein, partial [candidate division Zixibacteria bacterium]